MTAASPVRADPDVAVPRYTSYPTAPHLRPEFSGVAHARLISAAQKAASVSVYVHIPYCDRLCWFCGCHTSHTLKYEPVEAYVGTLESEIRLWAQALGIRPKLSALHFGGGSPSLLKVREFSRLGAALRKAFDFAAQAEISVELDPSDVGAETLAGLAEIGMTRASIGVQDFSPQVQEAINRPQTFDETRRVVEALRNSGVRSLNIDALYGLPRQTRERLQDTIEKVIALSPDRIALFGYAHVPWMKKHQRLIDESELPGPAERMAQAASAGAQIAAAGYRRIGIDHFARPSDSLAKAQEEGRLRRNFQGYTDDAASVLIGIGASSISQSPLAIVQNEVAIGRYRAAVDGGRLAPARGIVLGRDDRLRAWIIERLMCDFGFSFARLRNEFGRDADEYVALADSIAAGDREGLCVVTDGGFEIRETARPFTRIVASRFDAHLQNGPARYSKAV